MGKVVAGRAEAAHRAGENAGGSDDGTGAESAIVRRKRDHLDIVLSGRAAPGTKSAGFERFDFVHAALPELHADRVSTATTFLGRPLSAPLLVSAMTGGPDRAAAINRNIAEACQAMGLAMAVGSQRVALEGGASAGLAGELRRIAPSIPLMGNLGAAQLNLGYGADEARRLVDMIEADALTIHLNPLQEALQHGGDRDWRGLLGRIEALAAALPVPLGIKEVGNGISGPLARRLVDAGAAVIDVAGAGGTSWAAVEGERHADPLMREVAAAFGDWGIPTADAVRAVRARCPDTALVASGGVRNGVDVAKAIALGADMAGQAAATLAAALQSADALAAHFRVVVEQLRVAMFCVGAGDLKALRGAELVEGQAATLP